MYAEIDINGMAEVAGERLKEFAMTPAGNVTLMLLGALVVIGWTKNRVIGAVSAWKWVREKLWPAKPGETIFTSGSLTTSGEITFESPKPDNRVFIEAPNDVEISVKPKQEAKVTVVNLKHEGKPDPVTGTAPRPPEHLSFTPEQEAWLEKTLASLRGIGEPAADARAREERASRGRPCI